MKITKIIAIACATFALVACGGEAEEKAWEKADADAYSAACVEAGGVKEKCDCQAAEMGKTVAYADKDSEDAAKKTGYTDAETAAVTECAKDKDDSKKDS